MVRLACLSRGYVQFPISNDKTTKGRQSVTINRLISETLSGFLPARAKWKDQKNKQLNIVGKIVNKRAR